LVTKPVWVESLRTDYLNEFYPDQTRKLNLSGYAIVECQVTDAGALQDCGLVAEEPKREGFGVALLRIPRFLKIGPVDEAGQRTVDRPIRLAAQFGRLKDKWDEDGRPAFGLNLYVTGD
jgi:hypothetical protein